MDGGALILDTSVLQMKKFERVYQLYLISKMACHTVNKCNM